MSESNHHHHPQHRLVKLLSPLACRRQLKKMKGSLFHKSSSNHNNSPGSPLRLPRRLPLHRDDYDCINSTHFQAPSSPSKMRIKLRLPNLHREDYDRLSSAHLTPLPKTNDYDRLSSGHFAPLPKNSL